MVNQKKTKRKNEYVPVPPKLADKLTKQQVMQLAAEKGLMIGQGKEADISGLQELANKNGMNLKTLTQEQATNLIEILRAYQVIQEVPEEDIKPVEDNIPTVDAEIIEQEVKKIHFRRKI